MEPWICPRCQTVWAWWVAKCGCAPPTVVTTTGTYTARCLCHLKNKTPQSTAVVVCPVHDGTFTYSIAKALAGGVR